MKIPFPPDEVSDDIEVLAQYAAQLAADRGYTGSDGAFYAFTLASLFVNSVFLGNLPDPDRGDGLTDLSWTGLPVGSPTHVPHLRVVA